MIKNLLKKMVEPFLFKYLVINLTIRMMQSNTIDQFEIVIVHITKSRL